MTEYKIGDTVITVVRGDITQTQAEAIVNPANSKLIMGGGVAGAIRRSGGPAVEREALRRAPIRVGEAIATNAGKLAARYVVHAPTMPLPAMSTDLESVQKATSAALRVAKALGISSIAIPGMGTGVGGVPVNEAAQAMVGAIRQHLSEGTSLKHIFLVSTDERLTRAFESVLR
ncbi:MAG TPA: macro domain-containing protein [Candidatus Acidoferrum sp.]|nr:macro domain-containing protein [Candidatus Acidoferrum sp.]